MECDPYYLTITKESIINNALKSGTITWNLDVIHKREVSFTLKWCVCMKGLSWYQSADVWCALSDPLSLSCSFPFAVCFFLFLSGFKVRKRGSLSLSHYDVATTSTRAYPSPFPRGAGRDVGNSKGKFCAGGRALPEPTDGADRGCSVARDSACGVNPIGII